MQYFYFLGLLKSKELHIELSGNHNKDNYMKFSFKIIIGTLITLTSQLSLAVSPIQTKITSVQVGERGGLERINIQSNCDGTADPKSVWTDTTSDIAGRQALLSIATAAQLTGKSVLVYFTVDGENNCRLKKLRLRD